MLALGVTLVASAAFAKRTSDGALYNYVPTVETIKATSDNPTNDLMASPPYGPGTTDLYNAKFEVGASCNQSSWTKVDLTAQIGNFWHVDNFAGMGAAYFPLAGAQSLWCGSRTSATGGINAVCAYQALPGYGNSWNQGWCTKTCIPVSGDGILDVTFMARFDSEPSYDATTLQYTLDCTGATGWTDLDGGTGVWDGTIPVGTITGGAYLIGTTGPVKVRFLFASDTAWSDQDNLWNTNGAVVIDNLVAEGLPLEDFEGEPVGNASNSSNDWTTCNPSGFGQYMALFPGQGQVQQDLCLRDLLCLWAAISGSTETYACGGFPAQAAVPKGNADGQYLTNEVWSPEIALVGSGAVVNISFWAYRDMPLDNLLFYVWHVRTRASGSTCPGPWRDRNFVYYGGQKDWLNQVQSVGDLLLLAPGNVMQMALGIYDMCGAWCGIYGTGACHGHAPLLDNVKIYRVTALGPQWSIRDIDQFQDTFATDGTITGTARADAAIDRAPGPNFNSIFPGDSSVVKVSDPVSGLASDAGRAAVYAYVRVVPTQAAKSGAALTQNATRWPVTGTYIDGSANSWTIVKLDSTRAGTGSPVPDSFCLDLNDNLFRPGDEIRFFYGARNTAGTWTYASNSNLGGSYTDQNAAAVNASEFSILPINGTGSGTNDILYVDGMDGRGSQPFFDTAFQSLGLLNAIDRYDVRGPSSAVANRPGARVKNVANQLLVPYRKIIWDTGDLTITLGNGTGTPEKSKDFDMVTSFLSGLTSGGGVYIGGDDFIDEVRKYQTSVNPNGASAIAFKTTWLPHTMTTGNHVPTQGVSPVGSAVPAGAITSDPTFIIFGGCPLINDFDVITPTAPTVNQVCYGTTTVSATSTNGAVVSKVTNNGSSNVAVVVSGFSFIYIKDNDNNGVMDRAHFLKDVITFLGNTVTGPTPVASSKVNSLDQNYPNPFNPQTTIAFSVKDRGLVTLKVYNVAGELVRTLANEEFIAGAHAKVWDGRNDAGQPVSSGVYFYKLVTNNFSQTKKMVLLK